MLKNQKIPQLVPLRFGSVYCELCRDMIMCGQRVAWWRLMDYRGENVAKSQRWRTRKATYCRTCHKANIDARKRGEPSPIRRAA